MKTNPDWKYYFCHEWDVERFTWEDVLVLPDDPDYLGEALWLTIDCLPPEPTPGSDPDTVAWYRKRKRAIGDKPYWVRIFPADPIGDADMILAVRDFSKSELAEWVKTLLSENGIAVRDMIERPIADFVGHSEHADLIRALQQNYPPKSDATDSIQDSPDGKLKGTNLWEVRR